MAKGLRSLLGLRIRELRKAKDWRQSDLAAHTDLPETYISQIETGARDVGLNALERLASALEVKLSELFSSVGN